MVVHTEDPQAEVGLLEIQFPMLGIWWGSARGHRGKGCVPRRKGGGLAGLMGRAYIMEEHSRNVTLVGLFILGKGMSGLEPRAE